MGGGVGMERWGWRGGEGGVGRDRKEGLGGFLS